MSSSHTVIEAPARPRIDLRGRQPAINGTRMNETLQYSCQWGCTGDGGMNRLALNDDDATVRRWFIEEAEKLGCKMTVDAMGNIFAVLPGRREGPPIAMGSHLDTQPTGGRYDGILGVLAGLEVLKAVQESQYLPENPLAVVVWTNEEGARFIPSMLGSAVWAHVHDLDSGHSIRDESGISVKEELERHHFLGSTPASFEAFPLKAHFELHIEQGPILDEAEAPVATVVGVQAFKWFEIKLQGRGSHAGTTPMSYRRDPLKVFAKMVLAAEELAISHGGLTTIGRVQSQVSQSTNVILDDVVFHLDVRHHEDDKLHELETDIRETFAAITKQSSSVQITKWEQLTISPAVKFEPVAVSCVREATASYPSHELVSGAGHDSVHTAKHCPTAMIFIRCKGGVSHHPSEFSSSEDITVGAQALLDAVLSYDQRVSQS